MIFLKNFNAKFTKTGKFETIGSLQPLCSHSFSNILRHSEANLTVLFSFRSLQRTNRSQICCTHTNCSLLFCQKRENEHVKQYRKTHATGHFPFNLLRMPVGARLLTANLKHYFSQNLIQSFNVKKKTNFALYITSGMRY